MLRYLADDDAAEAVADENRGLVTPANQNVSRQLHIGLEGAVVHRGLVVSMAL
jgi:hypothetical protein